MQVHLVDGTYELFRYFYSPGGGHTNDAGEQVGAVRGVLRSIVSMLDDGATHLGVATDHVITSFRNDLWADYKTGEGIDPDLHTQFPWLEDALRALGVTVWPMVEVEADDALGAAARGRCSRPGGRTGHHLHPRQGPGAVRRWQGRAVRPTSGAVPRQRRGAGEVRRRAGVDPRLARAGRRQRRRVSRVAGLGSEDRRCGAAPLRPSGADPPRSRAVGRHRECVAPRSSPPPWPTGSTMQCCSSDWPPWTPPSMWAARRSGAGPGRPTSSWAGASDWMRPMCWRRRRGSLPG